MESAGLGAEHAEKALRYSRTAGEEALDRLAWDEATNHFEHALEQVKSVGGLKPLDEAPLHAGLGRAYAAMGGHEREGFQALEYAFRIYAGAAQLSPASDHTAQTTELVAPQRHPAPTRPRT